MSGTIIVGGSSKQNPILTDYGDFGNDGGRNSPGSNLPDSDQILRDGPDGPGGNDGDGNYDLSQLPHYIPPRDTFKDPG